MDRESLDVDHYTNTCYFVKLLFYFISLFSCFEKKPLWLSWRHLVVSPQGEPLVTLLVWWATCGPSWREFLKIALPNAVNCVMLLMIALNWLRSTFSSFLLVL